MDWFQFCNKTIFLSIFSHAEGHNGLENFKQLKGQNVQVYTQEFIRRVILLGIYFHSQDTLLKYIGGSHTYLRHTIIMFNPTSLDEVCVQATHLEARGKQNLYGNEESLV